MITLAEIYNWFMTGKKPTQAQFWASWGAFWHKLEKIPVSTIEGLINILNAKAEKEQFDTHKTDEAAHAALFENKVDKVEGEEFAFKSDIGYISDALDILNGQII